MRIPLNAKAKKTLFACIEEQYGYVPAWDGFFHMNDVDNKVYLSSRELDLLDLDKLRVNSLGMYLGQYADDMSQFRLSIEGSQLIGPHAKKNCITLDDDHISLWLKGADIEVDEHITQAFLNTQGYIIIASEIPDYYGVGRIKNGKLLNFTPKIRRILTEDILSTSE